MLVFQYHDFHLVTAKKPQETQTKTQTKIQTKQNKLTKRRKPGKMMVLSIYRE